MIFGFITDSPIKRCRWEFYSLGSLRAFIAKESIDPITRVYVRQMRNTPCTSKSSPSVLN